MRLTAVLVLGLGPALLLAAGPEAARIEGRLERVDLERRSFVLTPRAGDREAREVVLEDGAAISSGGRPLRLEDLRPGEPAAISVADPGARPLRARAVKLGPSQHAVPSPGPGQP